MSLLSGLTSLVDQKVQAIRKRDGNLLTNSTVSFRIQLTLKASSTVVKRKWRTIVLYRYLLHSAQQFAYIVHVFTIYQKYTNMKLYSLAFSFVQIHKQIQQHLYSTTIG